VMQALAKKMVSSQLAKKGQQGGDVTTGDSVNSEAAAVANEPKGAPAFSLLAGYGSDADEAE
jgi:hypothetical protein